MNDINLLKYQPLIAAVSDDGCALAIIDPQGNITSACASGRSYDSGSILEHFKSVQSVDNAASDVVRIYPLEHAQHLLLKQFTVGAAQETHQFALLINGIVATNKTDLLPKLTKLTDALVDIITEDSIQQSSLNGMLEDISSRYEELNLFCL